MQVVYDPSVLVRCELAVLYARYVRGHAPQVQVRRRASITLCTLHSAPIQGRRHTRRKCR